MDAPVVLDTLDSQISALRRLSPLDLAEQAHAFAEHARRLRLAAIYDATRVNTYTTVADALGVSVKAVEKAVAEHRRVTAAPVRTPPPPRTRGCAPTR